MDIRKLLANPQFWDSPAGGAITSFGFPGLATAFGAGRAQKDWYEQLQRIINGGGFNEEYGRYMQQLERASIPDRASILTDSNALQNSLQSAYARAGDSGLGATAATLGGVVAGNEYRRLNAFNRSQAFTMADESLKRKFNQLAAMGPRPTPGLDALASGSNDFMSFLNDYFQRQRNPRIGGNARGYGFGQSALRDPQMGW